MTERGALWDWDLDSPPEDPADSEEIAGHEPITEPIPVVDVDDRSEGQPEPASSDEPEEPERQFSYARAFVDRQPGSPTSTLTFKPARRPWYRTKHGMTALIAAVAVALLLAILPLVLRGPGAAPEESTGPAPTGAPSSEPTPSSALPASSDAAPTLTSAPAPPPPPPPPPPAPAQDSAPVYPREYPAPRTADKPEVDVTRAPISVAPKVRTPPTNSADIGNGVENGGYF